MKVKELMIDDLVLYNETPQRILEISGIDDEVYLETDELVHQSEIQPIPITPEILEKNGFEKSYSSILTADGYKKLPVYRYKNIQQAQSIRHNLIKVCVSLDGSKYDVEFGIGSHIFDLEYVHEFQHALRLCEIGKEIIL